MIKLGEKQELEIVKQVEFGVYLSDPEEALLSGAEAPRVLLPVKQVPEGAKRGDRLTVFVYRDSKDRLIASTRMPKLCLHQVGMLTVKEVAKIGAFLDWGLEKDLLLPFAEQTRKVREEDGTLIGLDLEGLKKSDGYLFEVEQTHRQGIDGGAGSGYYSNQEGNPSQTGGIFSLFAQSARKAAGLSTERGN